MNQKKPVADSKDVRMDVKFRNNLVLCKMEEHGIETAAELSRQCMVRQTTLGKILNMQWSPLNKKQGWRKEVLRLSDFFKCLPEDLFSETHVEHVLDTNRTHAEMSFVEMQGLIANTQQHALLPEDIVSGTELKRLLADALTTLPENLQTVLSLRFGLGGEDEMTLAEVGERLGIHGERVRQLEVRALRKLRHPSRTERLRAFVGT